MRPRTAPSRLRDRLRVVRGPLRGAAAVAIALASVPARDAAAEPPVKATDPVLAPGRSLVGNDDASAIAHSPANVALMPAPELRWTVVSLQEGAPVPWRGHAIDLAAPFLFLGTGLRVDLMNPPQAATFPYDDTYQWVRWALAFRAGRSFAFGSTLAWSISDSAALDGQFSITSGATVRPGPWLGMSLVARDWNVPRSETGLTTERSWHAGVALRPVLGLRDLEVAAEAAFYDRTERWAPGGTIGLDVPYVGRLRGDVRVFDVDRADPEWLATAGLDVNVGPLQVGGGAVFGEAIGADGTGYYASGAIRGFREPGVPLPSRVVAVTIDDTPGLRGHTRLLRKLWRLADDDEVEGVLLEVRASIAGSLALAEELGDAVRTLRAHGKKVLCHLEDASANDLFVCSQADRIAINPAGGVRWAGSAGRYYYVGGTLEKLGVRADFVRIGAHKGAAEAIVLDGPTDVARRDQQDLVDRHEAVMVHDIGGGRRIPASVLRERLRHGPFTAPEAKAAGLVDVLAYADEVDRFVAESMGGRALVAPDELLLDAAPRRWAPGPKIAMVHLAGDMIDGESIYIPIVGLRLAGSRTIADAFRTAREDPTIRAVVFRIDSNGGSTLAADVIWREAMLTARVKPVVVSMASSAASGGYYAAAGVRPIFANRSTITGSIGIFYGKVDVSGLLGKLGVNVETFRSRPRADAESFFRPFTDDERRELGAKVKQWYDLFVGRVAEGRGMTAAQVDAIGRGKIWTGAQARDVGLVDRVGGLREALATARGLGDLDDDAPIVELPDEDDSLLGLVLDMAGVRAGVPIAGLSALIPRDLLDAARVVAPFSVYASDRPLARVEWIEAGAFDRGPERSLPEDP
jgi:protease-4